MVVCNVRTCWNYTHAMIHQALLLEEAIDSWTYGTWELRGLGLLRSDWKLLGQLVDVLEVQRHSITTLSLLTSFAQRFSHI
ncbi:hypothetical protein L208DRAFT_1259974 [Tricholoma matsutake]|nr:hypothetical protein L208DRAFT_1259974 [Tricholoma matsutake 945]